MKFSLYIKEDEVSKKLAVRLRKKLSENGFEENKENPEYIIVVGGDGTFLRAVHDNFQYVNSAIFLGVHTGNLGFYCDWKKDSIDYLVESLLNKKITTVDFPLLEYSVNDKCVGFALNEVTLISPVQTLIVDLYINSEFFETIHGTGVCVSTPSGSSGYNKSLGGALVEPHINSIQIKEIAPIVSNVHRTLGSAIVLGPSYKIELKSNDFSQTILTNDYLSINLNKNDVIRCNISKNKIKIGMHTSSSFLHRVKKSFLD